MDPSFLILPLKVRGSCAIMNSRLAGAATKVLNATQSASLALRHTSSFAIARHKKNNPQRRLSNNHVGGVSWNCVSKNSELGGIFSYFLLSETLSIQMSNICIQKFSGVYII